MTTTPTNVTTALTSLGDSDKETVTAYIASLQSKITELGGSAEDDDNNNNNDKATDPSSSSATASVTMKMTEVPDYDTATGQEDYDAAAAFKQQAADAKHNGDYDQALTAYTQAVQAAPPSALLYANRAICLQHLGHYQAAAQDCDRALAKNPDSAKALKVRGRLRQEHLDDWQGALSDLSQAQSIDFDPDTVALLNELTAKRKEEELKEAADRNSKEDKKRKQAQDIQQAQQDAKRDAAAAAAASSVGGMPGGMGGMPGGMGGMSGGMGGMPGGMPGGMDPGMMAGLMGDPELQEAMKNPKVVAAFSELMSGPGGPMGLMQNPAKLQELMADPDVGPVLQKLMGKFMGGGGGGMPGGMGGMGGMGMPGGMGGGGMPDMGGGDDDMPDLGDMPDLD